MRTFVAIAIAWCGLASGARSQAMITRNNSQPPGIGSAEHFTGTVRILGSFRRTAPARVSGATVTFDSGARTAWHTHSLGQTLIVTAGVGRVQRWGDPAGPEALARGRTQ
jgi:4-carboxymuconolactone decarboxylase